MKQNGTLGTRNDYVVDIYLSTVPSSASNGGHIELA